MDVPKRSGMLRLVPQPGGASTEAAVTGIEQIGDIDLVRNGDVTIVAPKRDVTTGCAALLGEILTRTINARRKRILFDLVAVHYIDSSGLAALVDAMKQARAHGGDIAVCGLQPDVRAIFELTRLSAVIETYPFREEALAAWA
jgi:anti-sigma B factor antagonist